jgi:hypothetical protein
MTQTCSIGQMNSRRVLHGAAIFHDITAGSTEVLSMLFSVAIRNQRHEIISFYFSENEDKGILQIFLDENVSGKFLRKVGHHLQNYKSE